MTAKMKIEPGSTPIEPQKTYETERFTLRPLRISDKGLIELYASDIRVAGPTRSIPHPLPPGATEASTASTSTSAATCTSPNSRPERCTG